jgi:ABC-type multidrug transport system fused ATPase/permease subunit
MNAVPRLLAPPRRVMAGLLAVLALGEAVLAVLFAAALDRVLSPAHPPAESLLAAGGIAALAAATLLLARWVGEDFAQSFVSDCRKALFEAVTRRPGDDKPGGEDARWLTALINDMAALRHYALRGTVRLWTSTLAAGAAGAWVFAMMPGLRTGLVPLLTGGIAVLLAVWPLSRAIASQRRQRGKLNRFLVRRVRAELAGEVAPRRHGFKKLALLSEELTHSAVARARSAGAMDAAATLAGLAAALVIVWQSRALTTSGGAAGLAGSLTLLGFIAARLLESARALHARIGGRLALLRLAQLLEPGRAMPAARPRRRSPLGWAMRLLGNRPALPAPAGDARGYSEETRS